MKVIVAGGRDFVPNLAHKNWLTEQLRNLNATEIVSGHARGADTFGEQMAHVLELNTTIFLAKWDLYGKKAGYLRNEEMAKYAVACILFPGGKGTQHMKDIATRYKLKVVEYG